MEHWLIISCELAGAGRTWGARIRGRMAPAERNPLAQPPEGIQFYCHKYPLLALPLAARLLDLGMKHSGAASTPSETREVWWWERQGGGCGDQSPKGCLSQGAMGLLGLGRVDFKVAVSDVRVEMGEVTRQEHTLEI